MAREQPCTSSAPRDSARPKWTTSWTIFSLHLARNPHLAADGQLTDAQARGHALFFREKRPTAVRQSPRCSSAPTCHSPLTHFTSKIQIDVGTATKYDTTTAFDVPQLEGAVMKPPYLHNGEALELEEIWTQVQSPRPARPHLRHEQGAAQRFDRVPEDTMRLAMDANKITSALRRALLSVALPLAVVPCAPAQAPAPSRAAAAGPLHEVDQLHRRQMDFQRARCIA